MSASVDTDVRSFVDLRAFAAEGDVSAGDYATARRPLPLAAGPVTIALVAPEGTGEIAALPGDEFVIVLAGALAIRNHAGAMSLGAGQSGVLPEVRAKLGLRMARITGARNR